MPHQHAYVGAMTRVQPGTVAVRVVGGPGSNGERFLNELAQSFPDTAPRLPSELRWSAPHTGFVWSRAFDVGLVAQAAQRPQGSDGAIIWVQGEREDVLDVLGVLDLRFRRENQNPVHPADQYVEIAMELTPR
jgi:hypothetical protein